MHAEVQQRALPRAAIPPPHEQLELLNMVLKLVIDSWSTWISLTSSSPLFPSRKTSPGESISGLVGTQVEVTHAHTRSQLFRDFPFSLRLCVHRTCCHPFRSKRFFPVEIRNGHVIMGTMRSPAFYRVLKQPISVEEMGIRQKFVLGFGAGGSESVVKRQSIWYCPARMCDHASGLTPAANPHYSANSAKGRVKDAD